LYAGPLVRWYRQDFPGGTPPSDPPDPADVAQLVTRWRAAFEPAVGPVVWSEAIDAPVRRAVISPDAWAAIQVDAALPLGLDEALARRPREIPAWPLLLATAWIPASFDGILAIGLPDQPTDGALASLDRLDRWVAARRLARWGRRQPRDPIDDTLAQLAEMTAFAREQATVLLLAA
jgi:hypothetical protein